MKTIRTLLLALTTMLLLSATALAQDRGKDKDGDDNRSRPTHRFLGVATHPYTALSLSRPSGPDQWSTGFEVGVEVDVEPIWLGFEYTLHDILTDDSAEVYDFDGTLAIKLGLYW